MSQLTVVLPCYLWYEGSGSICSYQNAFQVHVVI